MCMGIEVIHDLCNIYPRYEVFKSEDRLLSESQT